MTHLFVLLDNSGIPEDLKRKIREAAGKDMAAITPCSVTCMDAPCEAPQTCEQEGKCLYAQY